MSEPEKPVLEPRTCTAGEPGKLYTVRLYDGFDHNWLDIEAGVLYEEARRVWDERTKEGTEKTRFDDIDYFDIFEADTKMVFSDYAAGVR
jgi:hypothetical protein